MHTFTAAKVAVDAVLTAADAIMAGQIKKAYALVRPPGHHAHSDIVGGFCFFNNVAIAAKHMADAGKRVLIVDWDIHQGDGT
jgi:histone deacetylase 6